MLHPQSYTICVVSASHACSTRTLCLVWSPGGTRSPSPGMFRPGLDLRAFDPLPCLVALCLRTLYQASVSYRSRHLSAYRVALRTPSAQPHPVDTGHSDQAWRPPFADPPHSWRFSMPPPCNAHSPQRQPRDSSRHIVRGWWKFIDTAGRDYYLNCGQRMPPSVTTAALSTRHSQGHDAPVTSRGFRF